MRPASVVLVLILALVLQHIFCPYVHAVDNRLEEAALGTAAFTFAAQILWRTFNQLNSLTERRERIVVQWNDYTNVLILADGYVARIACMEAGRSSFI